ncbi:MAG: hypothetical protein JOY71_09520 [Acetobacteraceae bacterium]|nr:hypothetical protein [Acetobacteraceae bacterium]
MKEAALLIVNPNSRRGSTGAEGACRVLESLGVGVVQHLAPKDGSLPELIRSLAGRVNRSRTCP